MRVRVRTLSPFQHDQSGGAPGGGAAAGVTAVRANAVRMGEVISNRRMDLLKHRRGITQGTFLSQLGTVVGSGTLAEEAVYSKRNV
jgi:hypothetical protein